MCCYFTFIQGKTWGCQLFNYLVIYAIGGHVTKLFFSKPKKTFANINVLKPIFNMHFLTWIKFEHYEHGNL